MAKYHGPLFLPCGEGIKIFVQLFLVLFVFNGVICKSRIFDSVSMGRSLMYRRKRHGPKTDPWGSPEPTGMKFDLSPPNHYSLLCVLEKVVNPCIESTSDSIATQLVN